MRGVTPTFDSFEEFWAFYVGQHRDPRARALHYLGATIFLGALAAALVLRDWRLVPAAYAGYLASWAGHAVFEGNRPATFGAPLRSALAEARMFALALRGRMGAEVTRLYGSPHPARDAKLLIDPAAEAAERRRLRNRISDTIVDHPFTDYWEIFVMKHQNPANVYGHFAAVIYWYVVALVAMVTLNPWWLLALPASQMIGILFHVLFERTYVDHEDAVFSTRASRSLNRMAWYLVTGRYWSEVRRLRLRLEEYKHLQI